MTIFHLIKYPVPNWSGRIFVHHIPNWATLPIPVRVKFTPEFNECIDRRFKEFDCWSDNARQRSFNELTAAYRKVLLEYEDDNISCD